MVEKRAATQRAAPTVNSMVDLVRFERTPSTFAESRSDSTELQVQSLAEGTGLEPASDIRAVVFGTTALPVRLPFPVESYTSDFKSRCKQDFKSEIHLC